MLHITVHGPLHRIPLHCSTLHYIHTCYMNTWIHGYMNTWIHEYMNAWTHEYIHTYTHTHTYLPTCMHATIQCNALQYHTIRYATLRDITYIYYMIWHNIARVAFITWHRYTHTYIYIIHMCVCVWNIWTDVKLLPDDVDFYCSFGCRFSFVMLYQPQLPVSTSISILEQGVDAWSGSHPPTKTLPFHGDMTKGRLCHVPAPFSDMGCG